MLHRFYSFNFKIIIAALAFLTAGFEMHAQQEVKQNGHNVFYYPSGKISSEGEMKNGKPAGYWKSFYENGQLKSEGNRENFKLEGPWKFYSEKGVITSELNY